MKYKYQLGNTNYPAILFIIDTFLLKYIVKYSFYKKIGLTTDCVGNRYWLGIKWTPKNTTAHKMKHYVSSNFAQ